MTAKKKTVKKVDRYRIECFYPGEWRRSSYNDKKEGGYTLKDASAIVEKANSNPNCLEYRKVKIK
jgi:hypothetical protein